MNWYFKLAAAFILSGWYACKSPNTVNKTNTVASLIQLDSAFKLADGFTDSLIAPYRDKMQGEMNEVLGYTKVALYKQRPEGSLGNWAADAVLWQAAKLKPDVLMVSMLNHGGLRTDIAEGPITKGKIFEVMPFDNLITLIGLNPAEIKYVCRANLLKGGDPLSGMSVKLCQGDTTILIGNKNLEDFSATEIIWLATSDYMANGGDNYVVLSNAAIKLQTNKLIRNAMIEYLQMQTNQGKIIDQRIENRIFTCK